jgi:four helix bundle protein
MDFAVTMYRATDAMPPHEQYGLTSQMRRASVSIVSNIAEGAAKQSDAEFAHFRGNSLGSASELDTQLEVCRRLNFITADVHNELDVTLTTIDKMLIGLRYSVQRRGRKAGKQRKQ